MRLPLLTTPPILFGQKQTPLRRLPFAPERYFEPDAQTVSVPLDKIKPLRARPDGIRNANRYMWKAYQGLGERRKPISLRDEGDGTYAVLDGNSTYANAKASGWSSILARVLTDEQFQREKAAKEFP